MLRRIRSVSLAADTGSPDEDVVTTAPEPPPSPRRAEPAAEPFVERRKTDRRGMDQLRAEALQNLMSRVEDNNFGGLRSDVQWNRKPKLPRSRLLLLAVAILTGGAAAYLVVQREPAAPAIVAEPQTVVEMVAEPRTQVLVAREAIGAGQRVTAATVGWEEWPEAAVAPEFITVTAAPEAMADLEGQVARSEFVAGEPIRSAKLAPPGQGFLSTVIADGKRAVSVMVSAESASGGFIVPGDHVDVVMTRGSELGQVSRTILTGVRVMAINGRATPAQAEDETVQPEVFGGQAIATLELDPVEGEVIINASTSGKLSLVLRPTLDHGADTQRALSTNQAIRLTSPFWTR